MDDMSLFVLGYQMGKKRGGGTQPNKFYYYSQLPSLFKFDISDGWSADVAADNNIDSCVKQATFKNTGWDEEYISTAIISKRVPLYILRIYKNTELKFIQERGYDYYTEWYAYNGSDIGEIKKKISYQRTGDIYLQSVATYNPAFYSAPRIVLAYEYSYTEDDTTTSGIRTIQTLGDSAEFITKGEFDMNSFNDFIKAVRKFSDEFNATK